MVFIAKWDLKQAMLAYPTYLDNPYELSHTGSRLCKITPLVDYEP